MTTRYTGECSICQAEDATHVVWLATKPNGSKVGVGIGPLCLAAAEEVGAPLEALAELE
jgi:hypothetical protein